MKLCLTIHRTIAYLPPLDQREWHEINAVMAGHIVSTEDRGELGKRCNELYHRAKELAKVAGAPVA